MSESEPYNLKRSENGFLCPGETNNSNGNDWDIPSYGRSPKINKDTLIGAGIGTGAMIAASKLGASLGGKLMRTWMERWGVYA